MTNYAAMNLVWEFTTIDCWQLPYSHFGRGSLLCRPRHDLRSKTRTDMCLCQGTLVQHRCKFMPFPSLEARADRDMRLALNAGLNICNAPQSLSFGWCIPGGRLTSLLELANVASRLWPRGSRTMCIFHISQRIGSIKEQSTMFFVRLICPTICFVLFPSSVSRSLLPLAEGLSIAGLGFMVWMSERNVLRCISFSFSSCFPNALGL